MTRRAKLEIVAKFEAGVVDGKIVAEGVIWPEGARVTVLIDDAVLHSPGPYSELDANGMLSLSPELEAELLEAIAEADRGEGIPLQEFLESRRQGIPVEEFLARRQRTR